MKNTGLIATPDPTKQTIILSYGGNQKRKLFITVRDLYGQIIRNSLMQVPAKLDISDLHPGCYFVETIEGREIRRTSFEVL